MSFKPAKKQQLVLLLYLLSLGFLFGDNHQTAQKQVTRYDYLINHFAAKNNLHPLIVKALIWRESRFNQYAVGQAGEVGMMQITEAAVADWAKSHKRRSPTRQELFHASLNIEIGTWYLGRAKAYWSTESQPYVLAICEYNAGRKGMKDVVRIRHDGKVAISDQRLHEYAYSIIKQYYNYLAVNEKQKLAKTDL